MCRANLQGATLDDAVREQLKIQKWEKLTPRLAAYAASECQLYYDATYRPHSFRGKDPIDFAHEAIELVYRGTRAWDPKVYPDLLTHLKWVVRSIISNAARSKDNKLPLVDVAMGEDAEPMGTNQMHLMASSDPVGNAVTEDDYILGFYDFLAEEPDLQKVVECICDGHEARVDIAMCAGLSVADATNARKRLQTRYRAYRALQA